MRTRDAVIHYQKTLDDTGTLTEDLDLTDPVSALELEFQGTNGSVNNEDNFISDVITKVELVDGSDVLYSLSQSQLEALHFYKTGKTPTLFPSEWAGGTQRHACLLLFGRKLWDPQYGIDFTRFTNPQLKISTSIAAIRAASATDAFVSGSLRGTIVAKVMEDAPKPSEYLMAKEVESFTSSTGEKRIDLPRDYVYRMLMGRFWVEGSDIDEVITDLKLTCDTDKFISLNRKVKQLDAQALAKFGLCELKHDVLRAHNTDVRTLINKEGESVLFSGGQDDGLICVSRWQWSSNLHVTLVSHDGTYVGTAKKLHIAERGHALHATLPVPFGDMDRPDTWFDPRPYRKVEAVLTQAVAGACSIVLEQVRPLPA